MTQVQTHWQPSNMPVWPDVYDAEYYKALRDARTYETRCSDRSDTALAFIKSSRNGATPVEAAEALGRRIFNVRSAFSKLLAEDRIHRVEGLSQEETPRYMHGGKKC